MKISRWRLAGYALTAVLFAVTAVTATAMMQASSQPERLIAVANSLIPAVARIRGLEPTAPIQKGIKSRAEISQFITNQVNTQYEKSALRSEGLLLQRLGLIPAGMDYAGFTLKLLSEQVGGYYDPEKKAFYIAGWLSVDDQEPAMVHELTHALQDQHFDLNNLMQRDRKLHNDDVTLAHQAITEGDATAVMLDYMLEPAGKTFRDLPNMVLFMRTQIATMNNQFDVLKSAPEFIKETLIFPYSYGTAFLQQIRSHGESWSAVDKLYADLPASTEQIIHPEKYFGARDNPKQPNPFDPAARLGKDWKISYQNVAGEFFLYLLLKSQLPEDTASSASKGWGGDRIFLLEGSGRSAVLVDSVWDDQESANRFYAAMSNWMLKKFPLGRKVGESGDGFSLVSDGEACSIRRQGTSVRFYTGLPEALAQKVF